MDSSKLAPVLLSPPEFKPQSIFDTDPPFVRVMKRNNNFNEKNESTLLKDSSQSSGIR